MERESPVGQNREESTPLKKTPELPTTPNNAKASSDQPMETEEKPSPPLGGTLNPAKPNEPVETQKKTPLSGQLKEGKQIQTNRQVPKEPPTQNARPSGTRELEREPLSKKGDQSGKEKTSSTPETSSEGGRVDASAIAGLNTVFKEQALAQKNRKLPKEVLQLLLPTLRTS